MAPKEKKNLVRTSVQLPEDTLEALTRRWPGLSTSEVIRLALERHEFLMSPYLVGTGNAIDEHGDMLRQVLGEFDFSDFKIACRAMPSLVEEHVRAELGDAGITDEIEKLLEWIREADMRERIHMFDYAVTTQRDIDAQPKPF